MGQIDTEIFYKCINKIIKNLEKQVNLEKYHNGKKNIASDFNEVVSLIIKINQLEQIFESKNNFNSKEDNKIISEFLKKNAEIKKVYLDEKR